LVTAPEPLSFYVLTQDSERHLAEILSPLRDVVDDMVVVDSGSRDRTCDLARALGARVVQRRFDNFRDQRQFAVQACRHRWVLFLDSDEVPDPPFVESLAELKRLGFRRPGAAPQAFRIRRRWFVLGREVRAFYPVSSPDFPVRLFRRDQVGLPADCGLIHESLTGYESLGTIGGSVRHDSVHSVEDLYDKVNHYSTLAARDMVRKKGIGSWFGLLVHPLGAWIKWYLRKGSWRDGRIGWICGCYAYDYTYLKYLKTFHECGEPRGKA
jgi:glycosyltransferase involved in cell wall biosynthesis